MSERIDLGSPHLDVTLTDRVLRVRINRPERRNAISMDMYRGVKRAAIRADADDGIDVLVITGTDGCFAAGGDMSLNPVDDPTLAVEHDATDQFPFRHLERCRTPVLAAVDGYCHAGGLDMVMYSDVVVASDRSTFRAPELLRGIPDPYLAARIADHVGVGVARYLLFTAAVLDAHEARAVGLVGKVVPQDGFDDAVAETVEALRRLAPAATAMVKHDINRALRQPDTRMFHQSMVGDEMREGMRAFIEKRPANWPRP